MFPCFPPRCLIFHTSDAIVINVRRCMKRAHSRFTENAIALGDKLDYTDGVQYKAKTLETTTIFCQVRTNQNVKNGRET